MNSENPGNDPSFSETPPGQRPKFTRREIFGIGGAVLGAATLGKFLVERFGSSEEEGCMELIDTSSPEYFIDFPDGNFETTDKAERTKTIAPGVRIFDDIGLKFYIVQQGDTIDYIRLKLLAIRGFEYLENQTAKIKSFNIPERSLRTNMYIPIPMENKDREISDEVFAEHALRALRHLSEHPKYGKFIQQLRAGQTDIDIVAAMIAFAKQESGGAPIGQFEMHRYEPGHSAFSFSLFHVLMVGPGLRARRGLKRTEGQLYHPQNGAELCLAFMIEKLGEMSRYSNFDLSEMTNKMTSQLVNELTQLLDFNEDTASFYNGRRWRNNNPHYLENILKYKEDALRMLQKQK